MKDLMIQCWSDSENERPSFFEVIGKLKEIQNGLK